MENGGGKATLFMSATVCGMTWKCPWAWMAGVYGPWPWMNTVHGRVYFWNVNIDMSH